MGLLHGAACVSDADESTSEVAKFVPPRDTDVLIADLTFSLQGVPSIGTPTNYATPRLR